jgi:hypothetical protein
MYYIAFAVGSICEPKIGKICPKIVRFILYPNRWVKDKQFKFSNNSRINDLQERIIRFKKVIVRIQLVFIFRLQLSNEMALINFEIFLEISNNFFSTIRTNAQLLRKILYRVCNQPSERLIKSLSQNSESKNKFWNFLRFQVFFDREENCLVWLTRDRTWTTSCLCR